MGETLGKFGSAGGAVFLLYQLIAFFTTCYERISFRNRLLKRLYFARINDGEEIFIKNESKDYPNKDMNDFQPDEVKSFFDQQESVKLRIDTAVENFDHQFEGGREKHYREQNNSISVSRTSAGRPILRDSSDKKKINDVTGLDTSIPVARDQVGMIKQKMQQEVSKHYILRLRDLVWFKLGCMAKKGDQLGDMYLKGMEKLDEEMSIDKLLNTVRYLKIAVDQMGMHEPNRW